MPKAKHLSKTVIDALKPAAVRYEQPDLGERGLYLVVQPSGHKSWAVRYRFDGRPKKLTIKDYPIFGVDEARKAARQAKEMAKKDIDPAEQKKEQHADKRAAREADVDTFAGVARRFIDRYAKPKNRTWMEQARLLGLAPDPAKPESAEDPLTFIALPGRPAAILSKKRIQKLPELDVHAVIDAMVVRGSAVGSNRVRAVMNRMYEWAIRRPEIPVASNPIDTLDKQPEMLRKRVLSHDEIRLVWLAAEAVGYPFGPIFKLLLLTVARLREVAEMVDQEISKERRVWTLPAERSKNKIENEITLNEPMRAVIDALPRTESDKGFLFTTTGTTPVSGFARAKEILDREMLKIMVAELTASGQDTSKAVIKPWRTHDLRHTVDTIMHDELNVAPHIVEAVLHHVSGHKAGVAGRYNHAKYRVQKALAYDLWAKHLDGIVTGKEPESNVVILQGRA